jgi:beta-glucuronidase
MIRLFATNEIRTITELDGSWDFHTVDEDGNPSSERFSLPVPGCWEMHPSFLTYRGKGMYRRVVDVKRAGHLRFVFKGVSHTAAIFFNGEQIAEHYNAYTAFEAIVKNVEPGLHELSILVDNSFHEDSSLHIPNDYYSYGGIIRPVVMEQVPDVWIERMQFTPQLAEQGWSADIQAVVRNISDSAQEVQVAGECCEESLDLGRAFVPANSVTVLATSQLFPEAKAWSDESPSLYHLHLRLYGVNDSEPSDDLIERVGFRTITTLNGKIQVNGQDVMLKGFNRHEDHPFGGAALTVPLMAHDLDLVADMGGNCVRTSHYPNDERFLDLCDERGIFIWEENHARGLSLEQMSHPKFIEQCEAVNREMALQHVNHPSIVIWGILNECASDSPEGRTHYERQINQIRALDSSRPITFASHHRERELCFDLVDIVSCNLYPGWYTDEDAGELVDRIRAYADSAGGAGKPFIMSEFGGDGYYGYRDPNRVKGTEERHADIIEANLKAYMSKTYMSGVLIWQFCDCRVTEATGWLLTRAGTLNSKGIVDRYRRPKLAYQVVKRYFEGE